MIPVIRGSALAREAGMDRNSVAPASGKKPMKRLIPGKILFLIFALGGAACVRFLPPIVVEAPAAAVGRHILCAELGVRGDGVDPGPDKSVFLKGTDAAVHSLLAFRGLRGKHDVVWKWYDSEQALIRATDPVSIGEEGRTFEVFFAWDKMTISAGRDPGIWVTSVFVDGILAASRTFEIR